MVILVAEHLSLIARVFLIKRNVSEQFILRLQELLNHKSPESFDEVLLTHLRATKTLTASDSGANVS